MSKGLESLERIKNKEILVDIEMVDTFYKEFDELHKDFDIVEKELKALETIKKYAVFNGWSGDYTIRFWDMKEDELKLIDEVLHD